MEIVVPRASWSDVFWDGSENPLIPAVPRSTKSQKGTAAMHLPCLSFLSKKWGEVHCVWTCQVVGTEREATTLLPLCSKLYSDVSPEWRGENRVMLEVVDTVSRHTEKRGIWVLDRVAVTGGKSSGRCSKGNFSSSSGCGEIDT